jgi:hypothetical protein
VPGNHQTELSLAKPSTTLLHKQEILGKLYTTIPDSKSNLLSISAITMSGEAKLKPDKDFSKEVDKQLPEAEKLAKVAIMNCQFKRSY